MGEVVARRFEQKSDQCILEDEVFDSPKASLRSLVNKALVGAL